MTIQQISVFLENRAGQLAEITTILADHQINMRALHIAETSDYGVLRMIVDRPQKAASLLLEHGFILSMTPVLAVTVPDEPGALGKSSPCWPKRISTWSTFTPCSARFRAGPA